MASPVMTEWKHTELHRLPPNLPPPAPHFWSKFQAPVKFVTNDFVTYRLSVPEMDWVVNETQFHLPPPPRSSVSRWLITLLSDYRVAYLQVWQCKVVIFKKQEYPSKIWFFPVKIHFQVIFTVCISWSSFWTPCGVGWGEPHHWVIICHWG